MVFVLNFCIVFGTLINFVSQHELPAVTLPVQQRVQLLKDAINQEIIKKKYDERRLVFGITPVNDEDFAADYAYVDDSNIKLTPIMDNDERKIRGRNALRRIKTTPKVESQEEKEALREDGPTTKKKKKRSKHSSPNFRFKDIFYRRFLSNVPEKDREFLHCIDLITPIIRGHKKKIHDIKRIPFNSGVVMRMVQLLNEGSEDQTKDDVRSILYQISNINIRLFQWDLNAIKMLLDALTHEPTHKYTFKILKKGLKSLFASWQLDLSNTTNLLKQARIFRPPCVVITPNTGSTKAPSSKSYTRPTPPRPKIPCLEYTNTKDRDECNSYYY